MGSISNRSLNFHIQFYKNRTFKINLVADDNPAPTSPVNIAI